MAEPLFSERQGLVPQPDFKSDDYLPGWVRDAITNEIRNFIQKGALLEGLSRLDVYPLFRPYIWQVLDKKPPNRAIGGPFAYYIPQVLDQCSWWQFYDIIEQIYQLINQQLGHESSEEFSEGINAILIRNGILWKLAQGKFTRAINPQIARQIKEAHSVLTDPKFKGPDEQFTKAVEHLNKRPDPDEENCVKDAVGAVEAVANIIAGTNGEQLNRLLEKEPFRSGMPPTINQSIGKIYAYRGVAPGASHGQVGHSVVELAEAMWILATSAATILYFVNKFHKPVS